MKGVRNDIIAKSRIEKLIDHEHAFFLEENLRQSKLISDLNKRIKALESKVNSIMTFVDGSDNLDPNRKTVYDQRSKKASEDQDANTAKKP